MMVMSLKFIGEVWTTPILISRDGGLPQDKVVAITDKEFDLLLGVRCPNYESLKQVMRYI